MINVGMLIPLVYISADLPVGVHQWDMILRTAIRHFYVRQLSTMGVTFLHDILVLQYWSYCLHAFNSVSENRHYTPVYPSVHPNRKPQLGVLDVPHPDFSSCYLLRHLSFHRNFCLRAPPEELGSNVRWSLHRRRHNQAFGIWYY